MYICTPQPVGKDMVLVLKTALKRTGGRPVVETAGAAAGGGITPPPLLLTCGRVQDENMSMSHHIDMIYQALRIHICVYMKDDIYARLLSDRDLEVRCCLKDIYYSSEASF